MTASLNLWKCFEWGVPPSSKGDYAFVLHMLHSLDAENGRMAVVLPHGVLFRGASEGKIRKQLIEMNFLDTVIGLPAFWCLRITAAAVTCCSSTPPAMATTRRARTKTSCVTAILPT